MSFEAEQALRPELEHHERLLWSGKPQQGLRFRPADIFFVPFSLLWGGFAIFWEYSVIAKGAPLFFALWGVPFVLVGLYIIVGRFFVDSYQRTRTYYGVTDQRAIILDGLVGRQVKSVALRGLTTISLNERTDRSGSVTLGSPDPMSAFALGIAWPGMRKSAAPAFELVADVRKVYDTLRQAQHEASRPR